MPQNQLPTIEVDVQCGRINIGDHTVSVPIRVSRDDMADDDAFRFLCNAQLQTALTRDPAGIRDVEGQQKMEIAGPITITGVVAVRSFRASDKAFSATLSFPLSVIGDLPVGRLAERPCELHATRLGEAPAIQSGKTKGAESEGGATEPGDDVPGQLELADAPAKRKTTQRRAAGKGK